MSKRHSKVFRLGFSVLLAVALVGTAGCAGMLKQATIGPFGGLVVYDLMDILLDSPSAQLLKEAMPGHITLVTATAEMGKSRELYEIACFLHTSYGIMVEDEDAAYAQELYAIGQSYGIRALLTDPNFRKAYNAGEKLPDIVNMLDKRFVPALTWGGMSTGLLIIHQMDDPMALMGLPDAVAMVNRSKELDGSYFFGVSKAFLGAYYALMPAFLGLGGGPESSAAMFNEARAVTNGTFLLVDVFEARYLMTYIDDMDKFEALLNGVLEADSSLLAGGQALNQLAKIKATYYLSIMDTLF